MFPNDLHLKILLPTEILINIRARKVIAEAVNGHFCLLPRHADLVTALVPGILSYSSEDDVESFVAVDEGILVKCGDAVMVSTLNGVLGADLRELQHTVADRFVQMDEQERTARTALARLEAGTLRRFIEMESPRYG